MLKIKDLTAKINEKKVLDNFSLNINNGEIHVIMGKNGIGKSSLCKIILGDKNFDVKSGEIIYNNVNLRKLDNSEISKQKIFYLAQNPISIEGVSNAEMLRTSLRENSENPMNLYEFNKLLEDTCEKLDLDKSFIHKDINVGASGGERKKIELLHMAVLKPEFIILDELDSGLDVDSLRICTKFINDYYKENKCSILMITHHLNITNYLKPNYVHILSDGKIVKTGDESLVEIIEKEGFNGANIID